MNEADRCRKFVVPKLQAAGWDNEPHSIAEHRSFTDGRIVVRGNQATRRRGKRCFDGKQLPVVKPTDYKAEKVRTVCQNADELRARWSNCEQRAEIIQQLAERGVDFHQVAEQAGKPEADPFDLLCHLALNRPMLTRKQSVQKLQKAFFDKFGLEAREILHELGRKIRQRRRTAIHPPRRPQGPAHFYPRKRQRNRRQIRRPRQTSRRRQ